MKSQDSARLRTARLFVLMPLVLTIVFSKVSVPPLAAKALGIALPLVLLLTGVGMVLGVFKIHCGRLCLYLALAFWTCATQLLRDSFSLASLFFLHMIFLPYVLSIGRAGTQPDDFKSTMDSVSNLGACLALLGIAQYAAQFVLGPEVTFPLEYGLPKGLLIEGFNYLNALYYGSTTYKSNGVFFVEPSVFSQFLAISLLIELSRKSRVSRIVLHFAAMACTFSGTGLIVLTVGGFASVIMRRQGGAIAVLALLFTVAALLAEPLRLTIYVDRISEFQQSGTSGFERFVAWTYLLQDQFWPSAERVWTGTGAGSFSAHQELARYSVMESPFAKIVFEFGVPGMLIYFAFIFYCIFSSQQPLPLKLGMSACMLMNGAYSEANTGILLTVFLWPAAERTRQITGPSNDQPVHEDHRATPLTGLASRSTGSRPGASGTG